MSEFGVFPVRISALEPIPDADLIELATVQGYRCVVGKGQWSVGDWALYIPEQAILPEAVIAKLGLEGRLSGTDKNRVKAVRLRGCLSQGLLLGLRDAGILMDHTGVPDTDAGHPCFPLNPEADYAPGLGITKYEPRVPASMSGVGIPAPGLERWCDIQNIKALRTLQEGVGGRWLDPFGGLCVSVTEKVHGTCFISTMLRDGTVYVSSKGVSGRDCALAEDAGNLYWQAFRENEIAQVLQVILNDNPGAPSASLYGEVYGPGVQDLQYGLSKRAFVAFSARVGGSWLTRTELNLACRDFCDVVPVLYAGDYNYEKISALATGQNVAGKPGSHIREGVVVTAQPEGLYKGSRLIAKFINPAYLLRQNGTEFA